MSSGFNDLNVNSHTWLVWGWGWGTLCLCCLVGPLPTSPCLVHLFLCTEGSDWRITNLYCTKVLFWFSLSCSFFEGEGSWRSKK